MDLKPNIKPNQVISGQSEVSYATREWYEKKWGMVMIAMFALVFMLLAFLTWSFYNIVSTGGDLDDRAGANRKADIGAFTDAVSGGADDLIRQTAEIAGRPYFGNPKAGLVVVQFADFQCPYSQAEFPILRSWMEKNQNDFMLIFRNYPTIDENSVTIAEAAMCAHDQGKFWPMHDQLYLHAGKINSLDDLKIVAKKAGVDAVKLNDCLQSGQNQKMLADDFQAALDLGVEGTPTFFINGHKIQGVITADQWAQVLAKAKEIIK